jgi:hypothetical protein
MTPGRSRFGKDEDELRLTRRSAGNCRHWRDLAAMSVAQRLGVETAAALGVQRRMAYAGESDHKIE